MTEAELFESAEDATLEGVWVFDRIGLRVFAKLIIAAEREACASLKIEAPPVPLGFEATYNRAIEDYRDAIRARK